MKKTDILVCRGEAHTMLEWCMIKNLSLECLRRRLSKGMSQEQALTTLVRGRAAGGDSEPKPNRNCMDCIYTELVTLPDCGRWNVCDYIGHTGKCRPCPYGDGCTVKKKKEDKG